MDTSQQIIIPRHLLKTSSINGLEGRDIFIGFSEPPFKFSSKQHTIADIDSKLNARLITHFLPAVEIARKMKRRPRLFIVSAINMALLRNTTSEEEKKIMLADNMIKFDFLRQFFEVFFQDEFSVIEYIVSQDVLQIPEQKIAYIRNYLSEYHHDELDEVRFQLAKFMFPKRFNVDKYAKLDAIKRKELDEVDITNAFKYAVSHLFVFGDINFVGNYIHNPKGYVSIGNEHEVFFNKVRNLAFSILKKSGSFIFGREVIAKDNLKIVIQNAYKVPPPYNGCSKTVGSNNKRRIELCEVTYENERSLDFYETQEKLKDQMQYMYKNLIPKHTYQEFRDVYRKRYFDLKARYKEAYEITQAR